MSGKAKIENLTNAWYGYDVTSAGIAFLLGSWGILSIVGSLLGLGVSLFITYMIGRALRNRSSLTRVICIGASGLFTVLGTLSAGRATLSLLDSFSLTMVGMIAWSCVGIYMLGRSFMTLMSGDVKTYFR